MHLGDEKTLYEVIAILTKKLGGDVTITRAEISEPPVVVFKVDPDTDTLNLKIT